MPLVSSFSVAVSAALSPASTVLDPTTKAALAPYAKLVELSTGTAAGQADKLYYAKRTIAPSANDDLDLAGVLLDAFGTAITFVRVKGLVVSAVAANTNNVIVGAAASAQWVTLLNATGTITLRPGSTFAAFAGVADATGWAVTATTGDLLRVTNGAAGTSVDYEIVIVGASA
jgi:hypothetical protein